MQQFSEDFPNTTASSEMEIYRYLFNNGNNNTNHNNFNNSNNYNYNYNYSSSGSCSASFYPGLMNETAEAKALAASRIHHKEAEKRRRERINSHLDRLRSILPCTSKTDKATLLSKVVQRVLELKRQTSELHQLDNIMIPSENDEFAVYIHNNDNDNNNNDSSLYYNQCDDNDDDSNNKIILKASLCCEDRPDLFADLNGVLSSLNFKTLKAEMSSLGGRIQSVFVVSTDNNNDECAVFLRDALKDIVQRSNPSDERLKRRRRVFDTDANC